MTQTNTSGDVSTKQADLSPDISLQPHQQAVVDKVQNQLDTKGKARMLLYHSLGSGKTLSGLSAADATKIPYTAVVPAALRNNLRKEQEKFIDPATATPSSVMSHTAVGKGDPIENPDSILVDETHRFRNPESAQAVNLMNAAEKAKQVVLLTGTPVVNSPSDFAVPYSILTGEKITPEEFNKKYVDETPSSPWYKRLFNSKSEGPEIINQDELKDKLKGKVDYFAPLAPKAEINRKDVVVEMNRDQTDLNSYMMGQLPAVLRWKLKMNYPLSQEEITKMTSFMTGLRQVGLSTLPFMKDKPDNYKAFQQSPKLTKAFSNLKELLDKDPNGKALIFSNFIDAGLNPYQEALTRAGIPAASFTGTLSDRQRKKLVDDYNTDKLRVALLGPAGTEGLSFKGTKLVQLLDPHWNTTRGRQSEGRALRFDSHEHLPPEDRKVMIERYIARTAPGRLRSLLRNIGIKAEPGMATDDYLIESADRKQQLNEKFLDLLKQIGSSDKKVEKKANRLQTIGRVLGAGSGATGSYMANDWYLNQVAMPAKPTEDDKGITPLGRLRSNLFSAIIGGGIGANPGKAFRAAWNNKLISGVTGAGLATNKLLLTPQPDDKRDNWLSQVLGPIGLGRYFDPGKSMFPEWVDTARSEADRKRIANNIYAGPERLAEKLPDYALSKVNNPEAIKQTAKDLKDNVIPSTYSYIINSLGGSTKDPSTGKEIKPTISDVGTALAPHVAGGLGGGYLGSKLFGTVGDYIFKDDPDEDYESRRSQENRRWWLKFLGANLGTVGGTMASLKAMPHINKSISDYMQKKGNYGASLKTLGKALATGAGLTAAQYTPGAISPEHSIIPKTTIKDTNISLLDPYTWFGEKGVRDTESLPHVRKDAPYITGLMLSNSLIAGAAKPWNLFKGRLKRREANSVNPLTQSALLAGAAVATPSAVNTLSASPTLVFDFNKKIYNGEGQEIKSNNPKNPKGIMDASEGSSPFEKLREKWTSNAGQGVATGVANRVAEPDFQDKLTNYGQNLLKAMDFNIGDEGRKLYQSAGLATLAQGAGILGGGVLGMTGGSWLADKLMSLAVKKKLMKKRPELQAFLGDLASLAGAGVGAYAGLRGLNEVVRRQSGYNSPAETSKVQVKPAA